MTISLNTTRSGTSSQCKSSCSSCERPRSNFPVAQSPVAFFPLPFRLPFYRCRFCRESKVTELTGYQGIKSFSDRQSRCRFLHGETISAFSNSIRSLPVRLTARHDETRRHILPRDAMLARYYILSSCVRPFVCLSVTSRYCIDMIGRIELVWASVDCVVRKF